MYAMYAYIDPQNHPNVGIYIYMAYMECLGIYIYIIIRTRDVNVSQYLMHFSHASTGCARVFAQSVLLTLPDQP